jgi:hypothetical protein
MTAEKANLAKKIPSSPKKRYFFHFSNSTCGRGHVRDLFCHSGWAHTLHPHPRGRKVTYSPLTAAWNSSLKKSCTFFCQRNSLSLRDCFLFLPPLGLLVVAGLAEVSCRARSVLLWLARAFSRLSINFTHHAETFFSSHPLDGSSKLRMRRLQKVEEYETYMDLE